MRRSSGLGLRSGPGTVPMTGRPARSRRSLIWIQALLWGPPVLWVLSLTRLEVPISRPELALALFPKLAANIARVPGLADGAAGEVYALRYANRAVWSGILGLVLGLSFLWMLDGEPRVSRNGPGWRKGAVTLLKAAILLGGGAGLLWWAVFHASACGALMAGMPEYRAFQGTFTAALALGPGLVAGLVAGLALDSLRRLASRAA